MKNIKEQRREDLKQNEVISHRNLEGEGCFDKNKWKKCRKRTVIIDGITLLCATVNNPKYVYFVLNLQVFGEN